MVAFEPRDGPRSETAVIYVPPHDLPRFQGPLLKTTATPKGHPANWPLFPDVTMTYKRVRMAQGCLMDCPHCPVGTGRGYNDKEEP